MIQSDEARAVRKEAQLARLAAKNDPEVDYREFYANQPLQKAKAEINAQIAQARNDEREASKALEIALASGVGIEAAENQLRAATATKIGLTTLVRA